MADIAVYNGQEIWVGLEMEGNPCPCGNNGCWNDDVPMRWAGESTTVPYSSLPFLDHEYNQDSCGHTCVFMNNGFTVDQKTDEQLPRSGIGFDG